MRKSTLCNIKEYEHLHALSTLLDIENDASPIMSEIDQRLTEARKTLKLVHKNAAVARDTHLEELAQHHFKQNNGYMAATIKHIQHCKELKQAFRNMTPIMKGITGGVVNELLIPNQERLSPPAVYPEVLTTLNFGHAHPYITLDDQDKVMSTLIRRNKLHLHQTFDTSFATPAMQ
eukprot:9752237-Ditylum_brightwellii.AAC.1